MRPETWLEGATVQVGPPWGSALTRERGGADASVAWLCPPWTSRHMSMGHVEGRLPGDPHRSSSPSACQEVWVCLPCYRIPLQTVKELSSVGGECGQNFSVCRVKSEDLAGARAPQGGRGTWLGSGVRGKAGSDQPEPGTVSAGMAKGGTRRALPPEDGPGGPAPPIWLILPPEHLTSWAWL